MILGKLVICFVALVVLGQQEALAKGNIQRTHMLDAEAEAPPFGDRAALDAATHISKKKQHRIDKISGHPPPFDISYHKGLKDAYHKVDPKHHIPSATDGDSGAGDRGAFGESFIPQPVDETKGYSAALSAATKPLPKHELAKIKKIAGNPNRGAFLKGLEEAYHAVDPSHHIPAGVATKENGYGQAQYGSAQHTPEALYVVTNDASYAKVYQILLGSFGALVVLSLIRVWFLRAIGDEKMLRYSDTNGYASADLNDDLDQYDNAKDDNSLSSSYLLAGVSGPPPARADGLLRDGSYGAVI